MAGLEIFAVGAPAIPLVVGFILPILLRAEPARAARLAWIGAAGSLAAVTLAIGGRVISASGNGSRLAAPPSAAGDALLPLQMDALGAVMLATIALIGSVVAKFALRYLDRDPAQRRFSIWLSYTLAGILTMPLASNLVFFFLAWVMSSHGLHQLLTLYPERPAAHRAARKKFLVSRLGDLFLAGAFGLIFIQWGSLDFATIFASAAADAAAGHETAISWISLLIVLGAITKSAQFPLHTWLPDTMEAPTPVSALMHAGIINAGGFLMIRMSPLFALAPQALTLLAVIGAFSAMSGSLIMLTQNDVKRKLAFSTISQMGFMMLQCGLGAFSAALLHLVGHSFYKAHAFLSAGSWVDPKATAAGTGHGGAPISLAAVLVSLLVGVGVTSLAVWTLGIDMQAKPGGWVLIGVLALALAQGIVIWSALPATNVLRPRNAGIVLAAAGGLSVFYLVAISFFDYMLGDSIARPLLAIASPSSSVGLLLLGMFLAAMLLQTFRPSAQAGPFWTRLYVQLRNGFYLGEIQSQWVERIWPTTKSSRKLAG